jgi:hypothetical protein
MNARKREISFEEVCMVDANQTARRLFARLAHGHAYAGQLVEGLATGYLIAIVESICIREMLREMNLTTEVIVGAAVYGLAVVVTHSADMTRAGAYAAAAAVAWYALGPGSGSPRRQLNRMAGAVARTRTSAAAITLSVWALAVAAVLFATSQTPYYWPAVSPHLPSLHDLVMSVSRWLLRNTHL